MQVDTSMLSNSTAMFDNCSSDFYNAINDLNLEWQKEKQQYDLQIVYFHGLEQITELQFYEADAF